MDNWNEKYQTQLQQADETEQGLAHETLELAVKEWKASGKLLSSAQAKYIRAWISPHTLSDEGKRLLADSEQAYQVQQNNQVEQVQKITLNTIIFIIIIVVIAGFSILFVMKIRQIDKNAKLVSSEAVQEKTAKIAEVEEEIQEEIVNKEYFETNVSELISIKQQQDISRLRKELITLLWGNPELPSSLPTAIYNNIVDTNYNDISSLVRVYKLSIVMEFGLESHVYHFIPKGPNNKVVLYHQGHDNDFYKSKAQIRQFLDEGYSVVAFAMPLFDPNNQPTIQIPRLGKLKLTTHDQMKFLSPKNGHPVKYFIEPVVIMLNYLKNNFDYLSVSMLGISGGGWTTTLAAAIDTRIEKSFPVAGSYPIYLRSNSQRDWGDYEQTVPEIYSTVNYLELYILGSYGPNRK